MVKKILLGVLGLVLVAAIVALGARLFTPEDTWICQNGQWVKHGNPSGPMPTGSCQKTGKQSSPVTPATTGTAIANPASKNCVDKGGTLMILQETAGELGICKFSDGSQCEEWQFYRGECKKGQYSRADTAHSYSGVITKISGKYSFKDSSGVIYSLEVPTDTVSSLIERLMVESESKQTVTIIATENPPLSKKLFLKSFQEK